MEKNTQDAGNKFLSQIIDLIDKGKLDEWFNDMNFIAE